MVDSPSKKSAEESPESPKGISAFSAKVLDQLALSAWLPAALLTAAGSFLLQFRRQRSVDLSTAISVLTSDKLRLVILILPTLVLATLITQAFSFEAIRTLEGYWRRRGLATALRTLMIRHHVRRKERLEAARRTAASLAFQRARPRLLFAGISPSVVNALECQVSEADPPDLSSQDQQILEALSWRGRCNAWDLARVDELLRQEKEYPILSSRVLPTRLGNVIRATEDSLRNAEGDVEGFALRRRDAVSQRVQLQHDQFRTRLDMYCTLVFACITLAVLTLVLLWNRTSAVQTVLVAAGFAVLALTSYRAAIASAMGYGAALRQMDQTA